MLYKFNSCSCICQIHHIRLPLSFYCIKTEMSITWEGFSGKKVKNDQSQRLYQRNVSCMTSWSADVTDIFDHMRKPKLYWSECLVTKIKKKQNNCWKHLNMLWEISSQILKTWCFSLAFTKWYSLKTTYLIVISWITNACIAVWCLPT